MESEPPFDPHRHSANLILQELLDEGYPFIMVVGFEKEPENIYSELERIGGVELLTRVSLGNTWFFKTGSRWRRFFLRLEIAWHRLWHRIRTRGRDPGLTRIPDGPAD